MHQVVSHLGGRHFRDMLVIGYGQDLSSVSSEKAMQSSSVSMDNPSPAPGVSTTWIQ
jgi:hypothetical protein